ncbi:MAG: flagellar hook-associated protein 2 [Planctomycetota bacterium]|jgi:flagellar hook-associated protein 2
MSFGPIQFGGLASGLDTASIIQALLSASARPIQLLERQQAEERQKISLYGTLEGHVESLQEKAKELSGDNDFYSFNVDASVEGVASFDVTGTPLEGAHTVEITSLAQADRHSFVGVADSDTTLYSGDFSFDYNGSTASVSVTGVTLDGLASEINDQLGDSVTASVVNVGTEATPDYQMVLAGNDTGGDFDIANITTTTGLVYEQELTDASNAVAIVDGLRVERDDNVFDGVVEGLSFTAQSTTTAAISFSVSRDFESTKDTMKEFIESYNEVISFINDQNTYDEDSGPGGGLFGDSALYSIRRSLSSALFDVDLADVQNDTEGFSTLGLVGIDLTADGTLALDEETFEAKIAQNADTLQALFSAEDTGVFDKLDAAIDLLVDTTVTDAGIEIEGVFDRRRTTLNSLIDDFDNQIERLEYNLEKQEETLVLQYARLEEVISRLNAQRQFVGQSF